MLIDNLAKRHTSKTQLDTNTCSVVDLAWLAIAICEPACMR